MTTFEISDRFGSYLIAAANHDAAVLAYAESEGLAIGHEFTDAADLIRINELFIEAL